MHLNTYACTHIPTCICASLCTKETSKCIPPSQLPPKGTCANFLVRDGGQCPAPGAGWCPCSQSCLGRNMPCIWWARSWPAIGHWLCPGGFFAWWDPKPPWFCSQASIPGPLPCTVKGTGLLLWSLAYQMASGLSLLFGQKNGASLRVCFNCAGRMQCHAAQILASFSCIPWFSDKM